MKMIINLHKEQGCWSKNIITDDIKFITSKRNIKKWINMCLKNVFPTARLKEIEHIVVDVNFVNKDTIIEYNCKFRGLNQITNVLSFANNVIINKGRDTNGRVKFIHLGEMIICCDKIFQEAEEYHKTFIDRYIHIFIHSVLHLLGYDHIDNEERIQMEKLEEKILQQLGIYNPYYII